MRRHEASFLTDSPEVETSVDEGHRDWASLPSPVVDSLVRVLKDTRRWRLEGRSLRMLNSHWSAAVNMHVEEIRPNTTRKIVDADLASVRKFEGVTSVDISPFLSHPHKYPLPRKSKKNIHLENWYSTKLERIVNVLCQLPKLTQIEVELKLVIILRRHCARAQELLSRLANITSLYLYDTENLKLYGRTHLNTACMPRHSKLVNCRPSTLARMLSSLRRLESLEVDGSVLNSFKQLGFLDEVKHVTFRNVNLYMLPRLPNPSETVASVVVNAEHGFTPDSLVQLNRLEGLRMLWPPYPDSLNQLSGSHVARCLKVLTIDETGMEPYRLFIPREAFHTFEQLECLNIRRCHFHGSSLRGSLPNLKALRIEDCWLMDGDATFASRFEKLELLSWRNVCTLNQLTDQEFKPLLRPSWEKMTLPRLRSLSVVPILSDSELKFISKQMNLEVLDIGSVNKFRFNECVISKGIRALENLHNLRILQIHSILPEERRKWSSLLSTNFVARLEQLWMPWFDNCPEDQRILEGIKRRSPYTILKVGETCGRRFREFDRAYFI